MTGSLQCSTSQTPTRRITLIWRRAWYSSSFHKAALIQVQKIFNIIQSHIPWLLSVVYHVHLGSPWWFASGLPCHCWPSRRRLQHWPATWSRRCISLQRLPASLPALSALGGHDSAGQHTLPKGWSTMYISKMTVHKQIRVVTAENLWADDMMK